MKLRDETRKLSYYADVPPPTGLKGPAGLRPKWMPKTDWGEDSPHSREASRMGEPGILAGTGVATGDEARSQNLRNYGKLHGRTSSMLQEVVGAPGDKSARSTEAFDPIKWMESYGYADKGKQVKSSDQRRLILQIQDQYGLPKTGRFDETTLSAMKKPRCGKPDNPTAKALKSPSGYKINPANKKWSNPRNGEPVTYSIWGYSPDLPPEVIDKIFKDAFNVWTKIAEIDFKKLDNYDDAADIQIYFGEFDHGDSWPFNGLNGILAHAFYPDPAYGDLMGDMHFDESEFWYDSYYESSCMTYIIYLGH